MAGVLAEALPVIEPGEEVVAEEIQVIQAEVKVHQKAEAKSQKAAANLEQALPEVEVNLKRAADAQVAARAEVKVQQKAEANRVARAVLHAVEPVLVEDNYLFKYTIRSVFQNGFFCSTLNYFLTFTRLGGVGSGTRLLTGGTVARYA